MKPKKLLPVKTAVLKHFPQAYCVRLSDHSGYIVWPTRSPGPRGAERAAIGIGITATRAWESVNVPVEKQIAALRAAGKGGGK